VDLRATGSSLWTMRGKQARTGQQPLRAAGTGNAGLPPGAVPSMIGTPAPASDRDKMTACIHKGIQRAIANGAAIAGCVWKKATCAILPRRS
jgi:hypothetical protein